YPVTIEIYTLSLHDALPIFDQGQEVLPRSVNVLRILLLLLVQLAEHFLRQDLGEADDGVQRRPQLVGHVRQELGLMLTGDFELRSEEHTSELQSLTNLVCRL